MGVVSFSLFGAAVYARFSHYYNVMVILLLAGFVALTLMAAMFRVFLPRQVAEQPAANPLARVQ